MPRAASVRTGPGADRVDADVLGAEIGREIAHRRVERGLGDAHHVVAGDRALTAEIGHRDDRTAAARLHQRLGALRHRDQRVRADVEREAVVVASRVGEAPGQVVGLRERDRVSHQVEPADALDQLGEGPVDALVAGDVALDADVGADGRCELAHGRLDALALIGERDLCALLGQPARDRPGQRALVRDARDERDLPLQQPHARRLSDRSPHATNRTYGILSP